MKIPHTAVGRLVRGVLTPASRFASFTARSIRAHHHTLGKYTTPSMDENPPAISSLNKPGQIALTMMGVIPLAMLSSVTLTPLVYHSFSTLRSSTKRVTNIALLDLPPGKQLSKSDRNRQWFEHVYGLPGYAGGAALGMGAIGVILPVRVVSNTIRMASRSYVSTVNALMPDELTPSRRKHSAFSYVLGLPGFFIGPPAGLVYVGTKQIRPLWSNSIKTFFELQKTAANVVLSDYDDHLLTERKFVDRYLLGFPGLAIGAPFAPIVLGGASGIRLIKENWRSLKEGYVRYDNTPVDPEDLPAERNFFSTYVLGGAGYGIGALSGWTGIPKNSYETVITTTARGIQPVFKKEIGRKDDRNWKQRYILGMPGAFASVVPLGIFYSAWCLGMSVQSWRYSSGSMMNFAVNIRIFDGMAHDDRKTVNKILGTPGYVAAVATSPIPAGLFVGYVMFQGGLLVTALAMAPPIAVYKGVRKAKHDTRFQPEDDYPIQNLYAMLGFSGKLPENQPIPSHKSGNESKKEFLRHCLFFNQPSLTEEVFDAVWNAYQNSNDKDAFINNPRSRELRKALKKIKKHHFLESNDHLIDTLGRFVLSYLRGETTTVPENLYCSEQNRWGTFWGRPRHEDEDCEHLAQPNGTSIR